MAFGMFKVVACYLNLTDTHQLVTGRPPVLHMKSPGKFFAEKISTAEVDTIEMASQENVTRIGGAIGWGVAGAALLGPVGLLAGLIKSGGTDVTFVCKLKDGRKFLAVAPSKVWADLTAATFK